MKNWIASLGLFAIIVQLHAQAPQQMSFQAVVRDGADALIVNGAVGMRISLLQGSPSGTAVYVETHATTTNANGLATLEIGSGAVVSGTFANIDWANGPYYLKTETDPNGGAAYSITGTSQLLSVPYALHAANSGVGPQGPAGPQGPQGPEGPGSCQLIRTGDGRAVVYTSSAAYGFGLSSTGGSNWYNISLNSAPLGALASDTNVVVYTATAAYGFGPSSTGGSNWYTTSLNGTPLGVVSCSGRIVVYTASAAYGFGASSTGGSNWYSTSMSGAPIGHMAAGDRIIVYTAGAAYGFGLSSTTGSTWYSTSINGTPVDAAGTR